MQEKREQKGLSLWQIPEDLRAYGEGEILPRYADADPAHGPAHVRQVLANSRELLEGLEVDPRMVYVVAIYHDLGIPSFGRKDHEKTSARLLREDHRASSGREPRSLYGKIVSEADRDIDPERIVRRCMAYGRSHFPQLTGEEQVARAVEHIREKYGEEGM